MNSSFSSLSSSCFQQFSNEEARPPYSNNQFGKSWRSAVKSTSVVIPPLDKTDGVSLTLHSKMTLCFFVIEGATFLKRL
jgi:hypothetical protein